MVRLFATVVVSTSPHSVGWDLDGGGDGLDAVDAVKYAS
jgi:hypothetical protein